MRVSRDMPAKHSERTKPSASYERHLLNLDGALWTLIRQAAQARDQPPEELAADLLARGLEQDAHCTRAETALASLSPREQQVTLLTLQGLTNRQIATMLVISPETVKTHVRHALEKFGLHSKAELRLLLIDLRSIR